MLPAPFKLVVRQVRTDRGMVTDLAASRQLKVIDEVFGKCDSIIVATDAAREGELIFRYIYQYLGYTKPFRRLWISSLTDEAIREGLANLKEGREYDSLYAAADCRAKADWLVGMNASRALAVASGTANNSIGRVQTPTLAMICARFKENRGFVPSLYWQLHITLEKNGAHRKFFHVGDFKEKAGAENAFASIIPGTMATVTKTERKNTVQAAPLLYDLTALQKDCNVHHDLTAERTLAIAQTLYEKKLISYPRTGSRYIPDDVMRQIPTLLEKVSSMKEFRAYGQEFDLEKLNVRSVDGSKVTDHHTLIITGVDPEGLTEQEHAVYVMIAGRMLEAFSPDCKKEILLMEAGISGMTFRSRSATVTFPGWRGVFGRRDDGEEEEAGRNDGTAVFTLQESVPVTGHGLSQKKTLPRPLYTEATLLAAMKTCGKDIADENAREALRELGFGTPATRASIITTLLKRGYMERSGKSLLPTEKGMYFYEAVKGMRVADVELTGSWEKALLQIERHTLDAGTFMRSIEGYTGQVTKEMLGLKFPAPADRSFPCPKCGQGKVIVRAKTARCDRDGCGLLLFRRVLNKELTDQHLEQLLSSGSTRLIKGLKGKKGNTFDARIAFDKDFNTTLVFPKKK